MGKAKPILYSIFYILLYYIVQIVVGVAMSFSDTGVVDSFQGVFYAAQSGGGQEAIAEAAMHSAEQVAAFLTRNIGQVLGVASLVSLIIFTLIYRARKKHFFSATKIDSRPKARDVWCGLALGPGLLMVSSFIIFALSSIAAYQAGIENYNQMVSPITEGNLLASLLGVGIIVPVVEEAMFRGMVLGELGKAFPVGAAITIQGVLFGLYHINPVQMSFAIPLGIFLGYCVHKTQSLWVSIATHAAMNSVSLLMVTPELSGYFQSNAGAAVFLFVSLALFAAAVVYFIRRERAPEHEEKKDEKAK